jgi:hypothetical protein
LSQSLNAEIKRVTGERDILQSTAAYFARTSGIGACSDT